MGAMISTVVYQPLLLGTASVLMAIAVYYQNEICGKDKDAQQWGSDIFKINMGLSVVIIIIAVIINFISGFLV